MISSEAGSVNRYVTHQDALLVTSSSRSYSSKMANGQVAPKELGAVEKECGRLPKCWRRGRWTKKDSRKFTSAWSSPTLSGCELESLAFQTKNLQQLIIPIYCQECTRETSRTVIFMSDCSLKKIDSLMQAGSQGENQVSSKNYTALPQNWVIHLTLLVSILGP